MNTLVGKEYEWTQPHKVVTDPWIRYVNALEDRLTAVESDLARHERMLATGVRRCGNNTTLQGRLAERGAGRPNDDVGPSAPRSGISLRGADLEDLPREEDFTDGMAVSFMEEEDSGFFGESAKLYEACL